MLREYVPLLLLMGFVAVNAVGMLLISHLTPAVINHDQTDAYELGMPPPGGRRDRFSVKFYLVVMLFIVFDIEIVFMIPWTVAFRQLGLLGLVEMSIFDLILLVGYVYAWKRGALEWD